MSEQAIIRAIGASTRLAMATHYMNHGPDFGYRIGRRVLFEVAAAVAENQSREAAVEICYRVGDRMLRDDVMTSVLDSEELMPGPAAALARHANEAEIVLSHGKVKIRGGSLGEAIKALRAATDETELLAVSRMDRWPALWWQVKSFARRAPWASVAFMLGLALGH